MDILKYYYSNHFILKEDWPRGIVLKKGSLQVLLSKKKNDTENKKIVGNFTEIQLPDFLEAALIESQVSNVSNVGITKLNNLHGEMSASSSSVSIPTNSMYINQMNSNKDDENVVAAQDESGKHQKLAHKRKLYPKRVDEIFEDLQEGVSKQNSRNVVGEPIMKELKTNSCTMKHSNSVSNCNEKDKIEHVNVGVTAPHNSCENTKFQNNKIHNISPDEASLSQNVVEQSGIVANNIHYSMINEDSLTQIGANIEIETTLRSSFQSVNRDPLYQIDLAAVLVNTPADECVLTMEIEKSPSQVSDIFEEIASQSKQHDKTVLELLDVKREQQTSQYSINSDDVEFVPLPTQETIVIGDETIGTTQLIDELMNGVSNDTTEFERDIEQQQRQQDKGGELTNLELELAEMFNSQEKNSTIPSKELSSKDQSVVSVKCCENVLQSCEIEKMESIAKNQEVIELKSLSNRLLSSDNTYFVSSQLQLKGDSASKSINVERETLNNTPTIEVYCDSAKRVSSPVKESNVPIETVPLSPPSHCIQIETEELISTPLHFNLNVMSLKSASPQSVQNSRIDAKLIQISPLQLSSDAEDQTRDTSNILDKSLSFSTSQFLPPPLRPLSSTTVVADSATQISAENETNANPVRMSETTSVEYNGLQCIGLPRQIILKKQFDYICYLDLQRVTLNLVNCKSELHSYFTETQFISSGIPFLQSYPCCKTKMEAIIKFSTHGFNQLHIFNNSLKFLFGLRNSEWSHLLRILRTIENFEYHHRDELPHYKSLPYKILYYFFKTLPKFSQIVLEFEDTNVNRVCLHRFTTNFIKPVRFSVENVINNSVLTATKKINQALRDSCNN